MIVVYAYDYPLWDRLITQSIRDEGDEGFLLPYHEYLKPIGDEEEDLRWAALLKEILVMPDPAHFHVFLYASEHSNARRRTFHIGTLSPSG